MSEQIKRTEEDRIAEFVKVYLMDFKIYSPEYKIDLKSLQEKRWHLKLNTQTNTYEFKESISTVYTATAGSGRNQIIFDQIWIDENSNTVAHTVPVMIRGNK